MTGNKNINTIRRYVLNLSIEFKLTQLSSNNNQISSFTQEIKRVGSVPNKIFRKGGIGKILFSVEKPVRSD